MLARNDKSHYLGERRGVHHRIGIVRGYDPARVGFDQHGVFGIYARYRRNIGSIRFGHRYRCFGHDGHGGRGSCNGVHPGI